MIALEIPAQEELPAMPKSNYRASGLVHRPISDLRIYLSNGRYCQNSNYL